MSSPDKHFIFPTDITFCVWKLSYNWRLWNLVCSHLTVCHRHHMVFKICVNRISSIKQCFYWMGLDVIYLILTSRTAAITPSHDLNITTRELVMQSSCVPGRKPWNWWKDSIVSAMLLVCGLNEFWDYVFLDNHCTTSVQNRVIIQM